MSSDTFSIKEDENIMSAIEIFSNKNFYILVVVNNSNRVTGIISRNVVFRYVVKLKQQNW